MCMYDVFARLIRSLTDRWGGFSFVKNNLMAK